MINERQPPETAVSPKFFSMKKTLLFFLAAAIFSLPACKQNKTEQGTETVAEPEEVDSEAQNRALVEEAEKAFKVDVVDEFVWKGGEHLIQIVNIENKNEALLGAFASKIPIKNSLYVYCFEGNAPTLDPAMKKNDNVHGAISVKNFIKKHNPVATLYRNSNGIEVVYKEGFVE